MKSPMMCNICTTLYDKIMTGKLRQGYEIKTNEIYYIHSRVGLAH